MSDPSLNLSEGHVFQGKPATDATTPADGSFNPLNPLGTKVTKSSASTSSINNDNNNNNAINNNNNNNSAAVEPAAQTDSRFSAASGFYDYHGYKIPVKPTPPGAEDCCMSGCAVCVYDVYEEDRQAYKESIAAVLKQLEAAGIPPPPELAGKHSQNTPEEDKDDDMDPSMKAFLELERKLKGG
ncbi:hypothetical protein BGW42_003982 [Actinomortierella wolfii]|nr:hypothetical protein BGW42_003982 [Actinomortierella wolfii]